MACPISSDPCAKNWEFHDGAEDGYTNMDMDFLSDSQNQPPLASISLGNRPIPILPAQQS